MSRSQEPTYADLIAVLLRGLPSAIIVAVVAAVLTYAASDRLPKTYVASATLLAASPSADLRALAGTVFIAPSAIDASTYGAAIETRTVSTEALKRLGVSDPTLADIEALLERTSWSVEESRIASLVTVTVRGRDPQVVADEANAVADALRAWDRGRATASVQELASVLEARLEETTQALRAAEVAGSAPETVEAERTAVLAAQRQLADLRASGPAIGMLESFERAAAPVEPAGPHPLRNSLLVGILGAVMASVVRLSQHALDPRLRDRQELEPLTGAPLLVALSRAPRDGAPVPAEDAAFIRAAIVQAAGDTHPRVVLVTSPERSIEVEWVASGLAASCARSGERTLWIDTDLRRELQRAELIHGYPVAKLNEPSLARRLADPSLLDVAATSLEAGAGAHYDFLVSTDAVASPTEALARGLGPLLERARGAYDVVVLTAAPVLQAADALVVAEHAQGAVLVVDASRTKRAALRDSVERLARSDLPMWGTVLTGVRRIGRRPPQRPEPYSSNSASARSPRRVARENR